MNVRRHKKTRRKKGGKAIAAGGYGCVFKPSLKCKGKATRQDGVSKLLLKKDANDEILEIKRIKPQLSKIKNFRNYFVIDGFSKCDPAPLETEDMKGFDTICQNLTKEHINQKNLLRNLDQLSSITMPDGGIAADSWFNKELLTADRIVLYNNLLIGLLENGVSPMNKEGVLHGDIKDKNILIDGKNVMRIIDWGLANVNANKDIPKTAQERPIQYNLPFTSIILKDSFQHTYNKFLEKIDKDGDKISSDNLRYFALNEYLTFVEDWAGHNEYTQWIFTNIFKNKVNLKLVQDNKMSRTTYEKTTLYLHYVAAYIGDVLEKFTTKTNRFDNKKYFTEVYLHNADVWGLFTAYYRFFEINETNPRHYKISIDKKNMFLNKLRSIFVEDILNNSSKKIDIKKLVTELKKLNTILGVTKAKISSPKVQKNVVPKTPKKLSQKVKTKKKRRCPNGTRRDKASGRCKDKKGKIVASVKTEKKALKKKKLVLKPKQTRKRCPKGSRRDKKTGKCRDKSGKSVPL